jgi:glyoxylase I family protein
VRPSGFHHVAIVVRDVERVAAFYSTVLELPVQARHLTPDGALRSIWLEVSPGNFLAIEQGEPAHSIVALRIARSERAQWLAQLKRHGVDIDKQSRFTVYVKDPAGNLVGLSHHPEDSTGI